MNKFLIFVWYIITEPFIELKKMVTSMFEKGQSLNYPRTWRFIFLGLTIGFYLAGNRFMTNIFGVILIATIIKSEIDSGKFMERWRERLEKKAEKQIKIGR